LEGLEERVEQGVIIVKENSRHEHLYPIIDGILVALSPEKIVLDRLRERILLLLKKIERRLSARGSSLATSYANALFSLRPHEATIKEFLYYEEKYAGLLGDPAFDRRRYGDHWYTAVKEVIEPMFKGYESLRGKWVLELGGGDFYSLASTYPQLSHGYHFVGTDVSFNALSCGQRRFPDGDFVLCDSEDLVFAPEQFDIIFIKGVLHHQKEHEAGLQGIFRLLKKGGTLGFTEVATEGLRKSWLRSFLKKIAERTRQTSPLNQYIDYKRTLEICQRSGEILHLRRFGSILRLLMARLLEKQKVENLFVTKLIYFTDRLLNCLPPFRWIHLTSTFGLSVVVRKI